MKLINDVITQLIDPNKYYSRFSFLASSREAIDLKQKANKKATMGGKDFFMRSTLIQ